jgi:pimeloyl-ACP methyl ester carboxylesterase
MKIFRFRHAIVFIFITVATLSGITDARAATGRQLALNALSSLQSSALTVTTQSVATLSWSWFEASYYDETYPLTVDLVGSNFQSAQKVVYMLPGGGVNFSSSFFTPLDTNLAQAFRKAGYLVVGITPREDKVPLGGSYSCMAAWGMAKHRQDVRKVVEVIQARLHLPYRILGHSFGAAYALDYAGFYADNLPEKVIALDIYSFEDSLQAADSYDTFCDLILSGRYADASYADMKSLMLISLLLPKLDSGDPRPVGGDFTYEGLLYYYMVWSSEIPGIEVTDWPLVQSYVAGDYAFAANPLHDAYSLDHSDMCTLREAAFKVGSGLVPYALYRDYFAANVKNGAYSVNWSAISMPVLWINTEYGYGVNTYGATRIPNKGVYIMPGYGHLDVLSSRTAQSDLWYLLTQ